MVQPATSVHRKLNFVPLCLGMVKFWGATPCPALKDTQVAPSSIVNCKMALVVKASVIISQVSETSLKLVVSEVAKNTAFVAFTVPAVRLPRGKSCPCKSTKLEAPRISCFNN